MIPSLAQIEELGARILGEQPDPVVRFRVLRDVLQRPSRDPELASARDQLTESHWLAELREEQRPDGSWGRFHSADTRAKWRIPTTEAGVDRALALGLDGSHPVLAAAAKYVADVLTGARDFPDAAEKNERWRTGARLFAAATLAKIHPNLPLLGETWQLWATLACRTFASGEYDPETEVHAHRELTGISRDLRYLVLANKYALALLGARAGHLEPATEQALVSWIMHRNGGIGYLGVALMPPSARSDRWPTDRWLASHELLSAFVSWPDCAAAVVSWLWRQRDTGGLWDFGPISGHSRSLPISENWRRMHRRQHDWSTRVLSLLREYAQSSRRLAE